MCIPFVSVLVQLFIYIPYVELRVEIKCRDQNLVDKYTVKGSNNVPFMQDVPPKTAAELIAQYKAGRNNEDIYLNITQLITKYGYPVEHHTTETADGYILNMFRIPHKGPPVFLMHGLLSNADDWITAGPQSAIGYLLAQEGYDVWMGNARGNKHSRRHIRLSPDFDKQKYWNFSWDEIGRYDLPAMIDYVLQMTNNSKLLYIGHSQGTTSFFVMCSMKPEYNEKIMLMVALSPVAYMKHIFCPPLVYGFPYFSSLLASLKEADIWEFLPSSKMINNLKSKWCKTGELGDLICSNMLYLLNGFNYPQVNASNQHVILAHTIAGASSKQIEHYMQEMVSDKFRRFDYGEQKNIKVYGSKYPPDYPVDKITAPIALFYSKSDYLSNITDVKRFEKRLKNVFDSYLVPDENFSHVDFLWALDLKKLIYSRISCLFKLVTKNFL